MIKDRKEYFLQILRKYGAYLEGHFKLSSGLHSYAYIQCAKVLQYPWIAKEMGEFLYEMLQPEKIDFVISPALGGIIIGHEVAAKCGCRFIFAERENDEFKLRRGFQIKEGEKGIIIEDVITTGKATKEIWQIVELAQGVVKGIGCIINRSKNFNVSIPFKSIMELEIENYEPEVCRLCKEGVPLQTPGSRYLKIEKKGD